MGKQESDPKEPQLGAVGGEVPEELERELAGWPDPVNRLRAALGQNEFVLYGQPIVDLTTGGHAVMAEALVRLKEEEAALLPPGDFLPAFEHYRMMSELDRWVVGRAVTHLVHGSRMERLTINVANQSLEDHSFPKFVAEAAVASALPASTLVFEIDESAMFDRLEAAARFAASVKAIGCGVLIDGFGAHGVSFAPLKSLRVDFLKIDGSVVRNLARSPVARTKLNAIARISRTLGFELIAEGVEEQDVLVSLKAHHIRYAQGYGISSPLPMAALLKKPERVGDDGREAPAAE